MWNEEENQDYTMREITRLIMNEYHIKKMDFMGYKLNKNEASYHHLIIPKRLGGEDSVDNGAVLNGRTSHPYLHIIENVCIGMFWDITDLIIEEKEVGRLDDDCLKKIDYILSCFEKENYNLRTSKGKVLIKEEYIRERKKRN